MLTDTTSAQLTAKLQKTIPTLMADYQVPGLSLALIQEAQIDSTLIFGIRSSLTGLPITEDTLFEAASLSKPVFAYAALKLCERGTLDLDTPLDGYLPDPYLPEEPDAGLITMRHVLSHTPGFPNWRPKDKPLKMHFSPGERFSYSGEGYMYLQAVIEHLTGQEPAAFMASNLLKPFGMANSRFTWTGNEGLPVAVGHDKKGQAGEKRLRKTMSAASSLHCTPVDFARFMIEVMRPSPQDSDHLSLEMTREMLTAQIQVPNNPSKPTGSGSEQPATNPRVGWGLGWGIQHTPAGESIWHWGDNGNYRAYAVGWPKEGHGIVIMTNSENGQKVIDHILYEIIGGDHPGLDWLNEIFGG